MKKNIKPTKNIFAYIALFIGSFLATFLFFSNKPNAQTLQSQNSPQVLVNQLLSCPRGENSTTYKCMVPLIVAYLNTSSVDPLFRLLEKESQNNPKVGPHCHTLGHSIGRAMYQKYGYVESLNKCNPFCADGCTMGIMEAFLFANQAIDPTPELIVEKAGKACEEFAKGDSVKRQACIHGTGHGLISLVQYKTQEGLDLCKKLQSAETGNCYDAVFMEKFLPSDPARKVSQTNDLYEYCSSYDTEKEQRKRCFGYLPYAWKEWGKSPSEILRLCSSSQIDKVGCSRGIVRLYLPNFVKTEDMTFFELYEEASVDIQTPMKLYGAIYIVEYIPSKALKFCSILGDVDGKCIQHIKQIASSMDIDI